MDQAFPFRFCMHTACKLNQYEDHSVSMYLTELEARSNLFFMFTLYNFTAKSSFSKVFGYSTAVCDYDVVVVIQFTNR